MEAGFIVTVRTTRGDDIDAACGQLVGEVNDRTKRSARYRAQYEEIDTVEGKYPCETSLLIGDYCFSCGCVVETSGPEPAPVDPVQALEQRVSLARQYIGAGDWENAKRNLELAAAIDADNADVLEAFALVYQSTGEFELAESNFKEALDAGAGSRARNNYAAFLYAQGRYLEAAAAFREVTTDTLYSGRPRAFVNLGLALLQTQETPRQSLHSVEPY